MTLDDIKHAVDTLSLDERLQLRAYIDQHTPNQDEAVPPHLQPGTMRIEKLMEAARQIREGTTDEEWAEIEAAINDDYIGSHQA